MDFLQNWINTLPIFLVCVFFILGVTIVVKGGDMFVDSASWIAESTGIPKLIVGATIVSLGTTLPELLVSIFAAVGGEFDMAAGNAIGSVTANIALIMSISIIAMPAIVERKDYYIKGVLMFLPMIFIFVFSFKGNTASNLPLFASVILLIVFVVNISENIFSARKHMLNDKSKPSEKSNTEIITAKRL